MPSPALGPPGSGHDAAVSGGEIVPEFATHYYRASRAPFLNLSDLPDEQAMAVMAELTRERREGVQQRPFGRTYIEMRRVAEDRLRRQFTALGGRPERRAPHYFVLGESPWFRGLAADTEEIRVPVSERTAGRADHRHVGGQLRGDGGDP